MTAPPERLRLLLPPLLRSPHLSCWILLRPAGFVVTLEARDPLVWDQVAAHLALDHGAHCQSCGSALCPGGSEVMLLSSSAQLTFLPMWPAGPFSYMEPARSCLPSAELIRSSAFFLPYQALGANLLVVPGREAHVGPANGHGSLQPAASECLVSLQELPLRSLLLLGSAGGMNGCSCFPSLSHEDRFCSPV